ncbi:MAG: hypothetical protein A2315_09395 [Ignavibacteria bacterium RIFOXYB2_FULL_35_12]|nr:MAG: hypothetical protein A2058_10830 [Ignavibacteria bacterium GWA2_36_19]OGU55220.1 MAG: hypothetical protein A2006_04595 [Ignavibacteria bacterium GWC2_35_8]OGU62501.1 MAG: hypothetical protein A2X60_17920 [Ignavibacteria bacterium GWF2_35_20]OGU81735.1 MAG: hypothetical protein A2254_11340 [Ignavibacteria bacterium RIFOXYA2_FULL_35_9]OGU86683.1 MAG: hypothetical protein A3K31_05610 [Ignavibacteria bacterium RIFOXYA12_FULL_35_25]OGU87990.1 MAG: hypothetical protein A2492_13475 [Ignavibac
MNYKLLRNIIGAFVFLISLVVLLMTVQPSVSFWDCGEFIAASFYLQVPHPPGTPFFLLLGRIFAMIPFVENIGLRVNYISVLSSAASILFLYLIAVKLIENYRGKKPENLLDGLGTYLAAAIGALSFAFSDTFWFNGVEAEVYAFSTLLAAFVTWLMIRWHERADEKDNEKYILMIAYLIGLSTGVHLMSVLAIVPVAMVILFRKYLADEEQLKKTTILFLIHAGILILISLAMWSAQKTATPPGPEEYQAYDSRFKMIAAGISIIFIGIFWKKIFTRNSFYMPLFIGGAALFITYPGIVKFLPALMTEVAGDSITIEILFLVVLFGLLGYAVHFSIKEKKPTIHLVAMSFIFALIGFTTFAMVIIRSNQNPPMNENEPNTFTELVSYLNREQYGDFPVFKRRFATEPHQQVVYTGYTSDLDFFWRYQMNHMMTRYWLWNYAGREGWNQDDGANIAPLNQVGNLFGKIFNIRFNGSAKDSLFAIPLILGLLGIYFHFKKDWKMASVFMIMFILLGYLTAFYQNQQQPQPRERDYFYVGGFFVFSIWIAIAIRALVDIAQAKAKSEALKKVAVIGVLTLGIVFVPIKMFAANYYTHDRSKNYIPWDYSYNLLQSCAPNGVLFTNGDNDTFPVWYLQDVEGVRRDVKVVNLSLLNTPWYIKQMKDNDPYNVGTLKIRYSDTQIQDIRPIAWESRSVSIPIPQNFKEGLPQDLFNTYNVSDSSVLRQGAITFQLKPTLNFGNVKAIRVQDIMVKEIVESNIWERPIYFAVTCSEDSKIGLDEYLMMEGMSYRVVPEKRRAGVEFINVDIMKKQLFSDAPNFSKDYKPGFNYRGLNDSTIFLDENHKRMTQNYRNSFIRLALHYLNTNRKDLTVETLDKMDEKIPRKVTGMEMGLLYEIGNLYFNSGGEKQFREYSAEVEKQALRLLEENPSDVQSYYNPYRILIDTYENQKEYAKLADIWQRLQAIYPNDQNVQSNVEKYRNLAKQSVSAEGRVDTIR